MIGLAARCVSLVLLVSLSQAVPKGAVLDSQVVDVFEEVTLKRSEGHREFKLSAFGNDLDLKLTRTDDLLPENLLVHVFGEDEEGNPTMDDWSHRTSGPQSMYTDKASGASLMVDDTTGEVKLSGMLGNDLIIEPVEDVTLPAGDSVEKRGAERTLRHVIYRMQPIEEDVTVDDFVVLARKEDMEGREKRALPSRLYIPVHVVVDYSLWKKLDRTEAEVIQYMKVFYNAINNLYSTITQPPVSVSIQGITICKSKSVCGMVENHRLGSDAVNAKTSLDAIAKYAYDQRASTGSDYALMMVMTDYDLCSPAGSTCERNTAGLAYVGTVCDGYRFSKTSKTGVAEDHGAFDGLKTVAHEMGHILGMNHDGDGPAESGAPGARSCSWNDNYLMGQTAFVLNQFKWSRCSVDQMYWTASQSSASCLGNRPSSNSYPLVNKLPGKVLDLDNQCKVLLGPTSEVGCRLPGVNSGNDQICLGLMCTQGSGRGCTSSVAAAEGSYCGPQRHCLRGKCVCDPSAPLPTPPPEDPSCVSDNSRILISGKNCVDLLSSRDGLKSCNSDVTKKYCCKSRTKYCRATPITCAGSPSSGVTTPRSVFTRATQPRVTTTRRPIVTQPAQKDNCGGTCEDTPRILINRQTCADNLRSSSDRRSMCDDPTVIQHCCATRARVCDGYHWITESCDASCQDNAGMKINGLTCVPFLTPAANRRNYCDHNLVTGNCCASRRAMCGSDSNFGK